MISAEDHGRLESAIRDVEDQSAGELVVVVAGQANHYRSVPLLWALLAALAVPWPLIWFTDLPPARIFQAQLLAALAFALLLSWPALRFALVPAAVKRAQVHEAAAREFLSRGLTRTRDKTGILIYVALAEHHAEILADSGIADRVGPEVWHDIIAKLTGEIREGRLADGLVTAIGEAGAIMARHAPARFDDTDELPNRVILL